MWCVVGRRLFRASLHECIISNKVYYIYTILSSRCIYYLVVAVGLAVPATPLVAFCAVVQVVQLEVRYLYQLVILV